MKETKQPELTRTADLPAKGDVVKEVGKLPGQSAFTLYGCDLSTGEPHADTAGLPPCRRRQ